MTAFSFFGRLTEEKGFDLLFPYFREVATVRDDIRFLVFGDGPLHDQFFKEFGSLPHFHDYSTHPEAVLAEDLKEASGGLYYFGHRKLPTIMQFLETCDASVMPSRFLETFGLSALESLTAGVPVVCFKKGGLSEFLVSTDFEIPGRGDDSVLSAKLSETLDNVALLSSKAKEINKKNALEIAQKFSEENWKNIVSPYIGETPKKILLVTDFMGALGGIETHVQTIAKTLTAMGHEVEIFAEHTKKWNLSFRVSAILKSFYNTASAKKCLVRIQDFQPDVIWCHSILRFFGPKVTEVIAESSAIKMMTYHDLGYFSPFAAMAEKEREIPKDSWSDFYASAPLLHKIFPLYLYLKYRKIHALFESLAKFDVHFVPSPFMIRPLSDRLPKKAVKEVLPHFVKPSL